jgi:hypothetical protein
VVRQNIGRPHPRSHGPARSNLWFACGAGTRRATRHLLNARACRSLAAAFLRAEKRDPDFVAPQVSDLETRTEVPELCRPSLVPVVKASHFRNLDHFSHIGRLHRTRLRRVLSQRQVSPGSVIQPINTRHTRLSFGKFTIPGIPLQAIDPSPSGTALEKRLSCQV